MRRVVNSIKAIDQIGPQISFKYQNNTRIQTVLGGLLTVVMMVVGTLGFVYFSRDMFFRLNPITKQNTIAADEKRIPFSDYPVSFVLANANFEMLEPDTPLYNAFEIFPQYYFSGIENNVLKMQTGYFGITTCSKEYFGKFADQYETGVPSSAMCVDYSKTYNLDGTPSNIDPAMYRNKFVSGEGTLDLKLRLCDEIKKPGCTKPFLEVGQIQFMINMPNEIVNFDDYSHPIEQQLDYLNGSVAPELFIRKVNQVSLNRLITDDGFLLGNNSEEEFISTSLSDYGVASYNSVTRNIYAYQFTMTITEQVLERRYVKIQEILANIGGFMKLLFFVATLLNKHFSLYSFYRSFGKEINNMSKEVKRELNLLQVNNLVKPSLDKLGNQSSAEVLTSVLKKKQINTEVGFKKFVTSLFAKKKEDSEAELVFKYLDISYLTKNMIEVEMNKNN